MPKIIYQNHLGEKICLSDGDYKMLRETTLFDYEWSYEKRNDFEYKVFSFNRELPTNEISVKIQAKTKSLYETLCNRLLEVFEKDIYAIQPGKIIVNNDYYLNCYVVKKSVTSWYPGANSILNQYTVLSEDGQWYKDVFKEFGKGHETESTIGLTDYPYDFPFDYAPPSGVSRFNSDSFVPFDFELTFYGPVTTPTAIIGGNTYRVYTNVPQGQKLTINSLNKTIVRTSPTGDVNEFNQRDKELDVFSPIPTVDGYSYVTYTPGTTISLRAYTKRSEPKFEDSVTQYETQEQKIIRLTNEVTRLAEQLTKVLEYKEQIIQALISKEVEISQSASWQEIINAIYSLTLGISYDDVLKVSERGRYKSIIKSITAIAVQEKGEK